MYYGMNYQMLENGFSKREETLGQRIRSYLDEKHTTQAQLARDADAIGRPYGIKVSQSDISNYVHEICQPKMDKFCCIAAAMKKPKPWLSGHAIEYKHV